jgi:hypothetical protein
MNKTKNKNKNEKLKAIKNRLVTPKTVQNVLPVDSFYSNHGIIKVGENKYSLCGLHSNEKADVNEFMESKRAVDKFQRLLEVTNMKIQIYSNNTDTNKYDMFGNVIDSGENVKRRNIYIILTVETSNLDMAVEALYEVMKKVS